MDRKTNPEALQRIRAAVIEWVQGDNGAGKHTYSGLADEIGMKSRSQMSEFISGREGLGFEFRVKVCKKLGLDPETGLPVASRIIKGRTRRNTSRRLVAHRGGFVNTASQEAFDEWSSFASEDIPDEIDLSEEETWCIMQARAAQSTPIELKVRLEACNHSPAIGEAVARLLNKDYLGALEIIAGLARNAKG